MFMISKRLRRDAKKLRNEAEGLWRRMELAFQRPSGSRFPVARPVPGWWTGIKKHTAGASNISSGSCPTSRGFVVGSLRLAYGFEG